MATKTINVAVTKKATGVITTSTPVTLKNVPSLATGVDTIDELQDVALTQRSDGSTLVYDQFSDRYVVKHLDFTVIDGDLDGGVF